MTDTTTELMPIIHTYERKRNRLGIILALAVAAGPMVLIMLIAMINGDPIIALVALFFAIACGGFAYAEAKEHGNADK